jgi:hypothetical protein
VQYKNPSFDTPCLEHSLLAAGSYLFDCSVLHLIDALVKGILRELSLTGRDAFPTTPLDLSVAAVDNIDVRCAHVDCLGGCQSATFVPLTQRTESLFERTHLGKHRSAVGGQQRRIDRREEEPDLAERRKRRLGHQ